MLGICFSPQHFRAVTGPGAVGVLADWGDQLDFDDILANEQALVERERLLGKYQVLPCVSIYIITGRVRSLTTVLLPEEY